jgi:hypothetical protein
LKFLVFRVHNDVATSPVNLPALKNSLVGLLQYLNAEGRTNANCWAADLFFCSDESEHHWSDQTLPDDFHDVLAKMGEALHDTAPTLPATSVVFLSNCSNVLNISKHTNSQVPVVWPIPQ